MHKPLRTLWLYTFLVIWTLIIFWIVFARVALNDKTQMSLLRDVPAIHYLLVAIGVAPDELQTPQWRQRVSLTDRLQTFLQRKLSGKNQWGDYRLKLRDDKDQIRLYSPVYMFQGVVSSWASYVHIYYSHPGRNRQKELLVDTISEDNTWQYEVSLWKETIYNGNNEYVIEVVFEDGTKIERRVQLQVDYQRIEVGKTILYLDPHYIPAQWDEDILLEIADFDRSPTNLITYGCDTSQPQQGVLIEHDYQYTAIPACMSFSLKKQYLLRYAFRQKQPDAFIYDIMLPNGEILRENFPLYTIEMWNIYLGLVFRDEQTHILKTLRALGDMLRYELQIDRYETPQQLSLAKIRHQDGHTLTVETQREKLIVYMYKDRDNYYALIHPGLRYQYYVKWVRDSWKKIKEGSFHALTQRVIAPGTEQSATYWFTIWLSGSVLHINDGFQQAQVDIFALGILWKTQLTTFPLDQPGACETIEANFFLNLSGSIAQQWVKANSLWLVGKWARVSNLSLYHNGKTAPITFDQYYQGAFSMHLTKSKQTLVSGENIYIITATDKRWQEVCKKEMRITVE